MSEGKVSLSAHPAFCLQREKWTGVFSLGPTPWLQYCHCPVSHNGSRCRTITLLRGEAVTATGHLSYPVSTYNGSEDPLQPSVSPVCIQFALSLSLPVLTKTPMRTSEQDPGSSIFTEDAGKGGSQAPQEPESAYTSPPGHKSGSKETSGKPAWVACASLQGVGVGF